MAARFGSTATPPNGPTHRNSGNARNHERYVGTEPKNCRCSGNEVHHELSALRHSEPAKQDGRRAGA